MRVIAAFAGKGGISPYHGIHPLKLKAVKTLVKAIPGRTCQVCTFTFALPDSSMNLTEEMDLSYGDTVKIHHFLNKSDGKPVGGGHKSYSPTDISTRGQMDLTIKLYPDGENSQLFQKLEIGDMVGMSAPWPPPSMRAKRSRDHGSN